MKKVFKTLVWIILILFIGRVFFFQVYKVDSFKMASTLIPGDRVLVNKFKTGTRFPNSVISLPGADKAFIDAFRIPYFRFPGFRKFNNKDVVVFNDPGFSDKPIDKSGLMISRIAGIPGDTVIILDKDLYLNRKQVAASENFRNIYRVVTEGQAIDEKFISENALEEPIMIASVGIYDLSMDSLDHEALKNLEGIKNLRSKKQFFGDSSRDYFPYSSFFNWNRDQYGPLVVPKKGLKVDLSIKNIDLYRNIIEREGNELIVDFSGVTINGLKENSYTFQSNYYFILDDNRGMPNDSRLIGFIPETHLLGTSKRIIYSANSDFEYLNDGLKRVFKKISY